MSENRKAPGVSIMRYLEDCRSQIIERCTECGMCIEHCEIKPYTALKNADPVRLVQDMKTFLVSGRHNEQVISFAHQCINCLECTVHCPEGLEVSAVPVLAKARLVAEGIETPPLLELARPCQEYSYQHILSALQTAPNERWWLEDIPERLEQHDVVVFFGCHEMIFPDAMVATRDILQLLGLDAVFIGGGKSLCCGAVHLNTGAPSTAEQLCQGLVEKLEGFRPKTVLLTCPTCVYVLDRGASRNGTSPVRYLHLAAFLAERVESLPFKQEVNRRITVQDPCFTARGLGDYESPRKVLSAIKGIQIVEMEHNRENALCCGYSATGSTSPETAEAFIGNRLREAFEAGAEIIANVCAGCQLAYLPYERSRGVEPVMFAKIVAQGLGNHIAITDNHIFEPTRFRQFLGANHEFGLIQLFY